MKDKMLGYRVFKVILGPIYKFWYRPTIIGAENIPKDGPIVVVGNHLHIMDQCNIIVSTKRHLHYIAKKEYFDDKKIAWFFKVTKCISVDRSRKAPETTAAALDVLKNGHALGLFPEGTRNGLKEEKIKSLYKKYYKEEMTLEEFTEKVKNNKTSFVDYLEELIEKKVITEEDFKKNLYDVETFIKKLIKKKKITEKDYYDHILLPLKFGAVSLARKGDALLVPYAITGEYKFHSKNLVVRIGKPFPVGDNLEKANQKLKKEITNLIKENVANNVK